MPVEKVILQMLRDLHAFKDALSEASVKLDHIERSYLHIEGPGDVEHLRRTFATAIGEALGGITALVKR